MKTLLLRDIKTIFIFLFIAIKTGGAFDAIEVLSDIQYDFDQEYEVNDPKYLMGLQNLLVVYYFENYTQNKTAEDLVHLIKVKLLQTKIKFRGVTAKNFGHTTSGFAHVEV